MSRKYHYNENIFMDLSKEEDAYWLGFIYADGSTSGSALRIELSPKDMDHLKKFRNFILGDMPIYQYTEKSRSIYICSRELVKRMKLLGVVSGRGCFDITLASLPKSSYRHFIRGYVDGDGCLAKDERIIILAQLDVLTWINNIFIETLGINQTKLRPRGKVHELSIGGRLQAWTIVDYLYQGATVFLERKLRKTDHWKRSIYNPSNEYRGTHFYKRTGTWMAHIKHKGKKIHLGYFKNEIDAARAYDENAKKYHGEKAHLNFP